MAADGDEAGKNAQNDSKNKLITQKTQKIRGEVGLKIHIRNEIIHIRRSAGNQRRDNGKT